MSFKKLHSAICMYGHIAKLLVVIPFLLMTACQKFVETDTPKTALVSSVVFANDESATAAMVGIYSDIMQNPSSFINTQITLLTGLSSDEFDNFSTSTDQRQFYENSLTSNNSNVLILWRTAYKYIYEVNSVLAGISNSNALSTSTKSQIEGEAKFTRALCYFYLTNLFGDVPLVLSTDYRTNNIAARTQQAQVYTQIVADLTDAQNLLSETYVSNERVRPNKLAATALLARVYLYMKDWTNAASEATKVVNQSATYYLNNNLSQVFQINSPEIIWQLMPVAPGYNTWEGNALILTTLPESVALSDDLVNAFDSADNRKTEWINSTAVGPESYHYPFKYKVKIGGELSEYYVVLRLAEQYLIRSEAKAQLDDLGGSLEDLNMIRNRAGLPAVGLQTKSRLLDTIANERRFELFAEMGHRWFDIKRTNMAQDVLGPLKGSNWQATDVLYPIPQSELAVDKNLQQNSGY
jgi:starch-binding outer membrane protein, SusD/RagB family